MWSAHLKGMRYDLGLFKIKNIINTTFAFYENYTNGSENC